MIYITILRMKKNIFQTDIITETIEVFFYANTQEYLPYTFGSFYHYIKIEFLIEFRPYIHSLATVANYFSDDIF